MPIRIGVIGAGGFGSVHMRTYLQLERSAQVGAQPAMPLQLVAFAAKSQETVKKQQEIFGVRGYSDYKLMLKNEHLDAVSIVTPDHLHKEVTIAAVNLGVHVLVEKPMDVSLAGCDEMLAAARENGVLLQVDFHKRFDPDHQELEIAIKEGKLGEIEYGYAYMEDRIEVPKGWLTSWAANSSPAWFLGVHFYDLVRWLIKSEATKVYATGVKSKLVSLGLDTYDSIQAKIKFENGASFCFDTSWIIPENFEAVVNQGLRTIGTKGIWEIDTQDRGSKSCIEGTGMRTYNTHFIRARTDKTGNVSYYGYGIESIVDFINNVELLKNGAKLRHLEGKYPSGEDGKAATEIAVAVHKSIDSGEIIKL